MEANKGVLETVPNPQESPVEAKLYAYGLPEYEVELLLDRFVSNLSLSEIADRQGYRNKQDVYRLLSGLIARLKKSDAFKSLLEGMRKKGYN